MKFGYLLTAFALTAAPALVLSGCKTAEPSYGQAMGADNQTLPNAGDTPGQCSRQTSAKGDKYFVPSIADVKNFEAALDKGLRSGTLFDEDYFAALGKQARILGGESEDAPPLELTLQRNWSRHYMGIVRNGHRIIAGDFYPDYSDDPKVSVFRGSWGADIVCDGGPGFFGAEFDPLDSKITMIDFNGSP